jgi:hypothetical protein
MSQAISPEKPLLCPSAQPDWQDSVAIGVIGGTAEHPLMAHFPVPLPVTAELLALSGPVTPTEVFRFAAPCMCSGCGHFEDRKCQLATRIVKFLPAVADQLPSCSVRPGCRWWQQEGSAACLRCPQVVTDNYNSSAAMRKAATPRSICEG